MVILSGWSFATKEKISQNTLWYLRFRPRYVSEEGNVQADASPLPNSSIYGPHRNLTFTVNYMTEHIL